PNGETRMGGAQAKIGEPGDGLLEIGDAGIEPAGLDFSVAGYRFCNCGVERHGAERQRLIAILYALFRIPSVDVHCAGAPEAHHLDAKVLERLAVPERAAAILKARL